MHEKTQPPEPTTTPAPPRAGLPQRLRREALTQEATAPIEAASRKRPERQEQALAHAMQCARIAEDNRGKDIVLLDLRGATPLVDFFVLVTSASRRQSSAIATEIDAEMKRRGEMKLGMEGLEEASWILIDYSDFVVHIFAEEAREYYSLEDLWGDAQRIEWSEGSPSLPPAPTLDEGS